MAKRLEAEMSLNSRLLYRIALGVILSTQANAGVSVTKTATFEEVDWAEVTHCKATYYLPSVQTYTGRLLAGTDGWKTTDFPKTVIDGECHVKGRYDHVVVYEGKREWSADRHFFYINYLEDTDSFSINGQPNPSYSHAQWNITESALLKVIDSTTGCFMSDEVQVCFSAR
jgi:hypothetical protein